MVFYFRDGVKSATMSPHSFRCMWYTVFLSTGHDVVGFHLPRDILTSGPEQGTQRHGQDGLWHNLQQV